MRRILSGVDVQNFNIAMLMAQLGAQIAHQVLHAHAAGGLAVTC